MSTTATTTTVVLPKGRRQYVFRYCPGREEQVFDRLWQLAEDPRCELDWLDAATLAFQVACESAERAAAPATRAAG